MSSEDVLDTGNVSLLRDIYNIMDASPPIHLSEIVSNAGVDTNSLRQAMTILSEEVDLYARLELDDIPVYCIRVEFLTYSTENSGTDDAVFIEIGTSSRRYYLNKGGDDREPGKYDYYSITPDPRYLCRGGDITRLHVAKLGEDQWRIRWVKIYINNGTNHIFRKEWVDGKALGNGDGAGITFTYEEHFRPEVNVDWVNTFDRRGQLPKLSYDLLKHRFYPTGSISIPNSRFNEVTETHIGDQMRTADVLRGIQWGYPNGKYVESWRPEGGGGSVLHFVLHLKLRPDQYGFALLPDCELELYFDVVFGSAHGSLVACEVQNIDYDLKGLAGTFNEVVLSFWQLFTALVNWLFETDLFNSSILPSFGDIPLVPSTDVLPSCSVQDDGDIRIDFN